MVNLQLLPLIIKVPMLPPEECSPNWRAHWSKRYRAAKVYHNAVYYAAVDACNRAQRWGIMSRARLHLTFVFAVERRRDPDNMLARFKSGLDALTDAEIIADDDSRHLAIEPVEIVIDPAVAPQTIIEIEPIP